MKALIGVAAFGTLISAAAVEVYPHYMDPRKHPDEARREVRPPSRAELGNRTHFMALRSLGEKSYKAEMDRYVDREGLGDFVWGYYRQFRMPNFNELLQEIKRRNLYYFDIVGFIPGVALGPKGELWQGLTEIHLDPDEIACVKETLGDRFLGMDNGEQDGRYTSYAGEAVPRGVSRFEEYCAFQNWFERLEMLQGNRLAALTGLNYGHYFLKNNCYTFLGAETAQSLPNAQLFYSFIRGAGKQYGVPWFGNASLFGPTGWKDYSRRPGAVKGKGPGPENGASLALLRKLMLAQIFYNSEAVGFEMGYFASDGRQETLSPIGRLQQDVIAWLKTYGEPGVMHAPVAVMLDFHSGWSFPRHRLYSGGMNRLWATLPYGRGEYFTDGVLNMLYPDYDAAAYFDDEFGFNVDTPYGDIADCVLSDAPAWMLRQYPLLVLTTDLAPTEELRDTLNDYLSGGGRIVLTEANQKGLRLAGEGVTVIAGDGLEENPDVRPPVKDPGPGKKYVRAHPLSREARAKLDAAFREVMVFGMSAACEPNGLSLVTCRRGKGEYTVLVINNTWKEQPLRLHAFAGKIARIAEQRIANRDLATPGRYPTFTAVADPGRDTEGTIAAGSARVFAVKLEEGDAVRELPEVAPRPNETKATLFLRNVAGPIKREILRRPTFSRHFDSVMVDWRYLMERDDEDLAEQTNFLKVQQIGVLVDLSSGLNLFPDLRFVENDPRETPRQRHKIDRLLEKMAVLGAKDLVITLHRRPPDWPQADFEEKFAAFAKTFCRRCAKQGIHVHFRGDNARIPGGYKGLADWVKRIGEPNCTQAPCLEMEMRRCGMNIRWSPKLLAKIEAPLWFLAAGQLDENRQGVSSVAPLATCGVEEKILLENLKAIRTHAPRVVFDAVYPDLDAEYRDVRLWEGAR